MKTITYLNIWYNLYFKDYRYLPLGIIGLPLLAIILIDGIISDTPNWLLFLLFIYVVRQSF